MKLARIAISFWLVAFQFDLLAQSRISSTPIRVVKTLAELDALPPSVDAPIVDVLGLSTANDLSKPMRFVFDRSNTNAVNRFTRATTNGVGRWVHDWGGDVDAFGAQRGLSDQSTQIQAALDYASSQGGGVVRLKSGVYGIGSTLVMPPNVWLIGEGLGYQFSHRYTNTINLADVKQAGVTVLHLVDGADCVMASNSLSGNFLRTTLSIDGRGTVNQYSHSSGIKDIVFDGNASKQTRYDCHAIHVQDIFGFWIENCAFYRLSGRIANIWNANSIKIKGLSVLGDATNTKGIMLYDTSDTIIDGTSMESAILGPAIWMASTQTWFNNVLGGHWGDTANQDIGGVIQSVTNGQFTLDQNPLVESGEPVVFWTWDGTLPVGVTAGKTYFAVKYATNIFGVSDNITNAWAGVCLTNLTDAGTSAMIKPGLSVGLYLSDGTQHNTVTGARFDNGFDGAVVFDNANYNTIANCRIMRSGMFSDGLTFTNNRVGLWIKNGNHNILDELDFYNNPMGLWVNDTLNLIGKRKFYGSTTNEYISVENFFPLMVDQTGKIRGFDPQNGDTTLGNLNFKIVQTNTTTQPLRIEGGGTVSIAMQRTAGVASEYQFGLTAINSVDGIAMVNVENARQVAVVGGDADESYIYGGVVSATPYSLTIGAQPAAGTDIAGPALILTPTRSTGSATNAGVVIRGYNPGSSGASAQSILNSLRVRASSTAGETDLEVRTVDDGTLFRIKVGAAGTGPGGSGRAIYID